MREPQFSVNELLRKTDDIEYLLDIIQNGHPSIDEDHYCWDALKVLEEMTEEEILSLYQTVNG